MTVGTLLRRGLTHYWRTNLAVIAGVGVAVSVLAGALLVGGSVRASLRDLALLRLGRVDHVVTSGLFFRVALADDLLASSALEGAVTDAVPMIALEGFATHQETGSRAGGIQVYGVDERFWAFHGLEADGRVPEPGAVMVSAGLARELGAVVDEDAAGPHPETVGNPGRFAARAARRSRADDAVAHPTGAGVGRSRRVLVSTAAGALACRVRQSRADAAGSGAGPAGQHDPDGHRRW